MRLLNTCEMQTVSGSDFVGGAIWMATSVRDLVVGAAGATVGAMLTGSFLSTNKAFNSMMGNYVTGPVSDMCVMGAGAIVGFYAARGVQEWYNASYNANYSAN